MDFQIKIINEEVCEKKFDFGGVEKLSDELKLKIMELYLNNFIDNTYDDNEYLYHLGNKYQLENDFINMEKYYKLSSEKGNIKAISELGGFYETVQDFEKMKELYFIIKKFNDYQLLLRIEFYFVSELDKIGKKYGIESEINDEVLNLSNEIKIKIIDLLNNGIIDNNCDNSYYLYFLGFYYADDCEKSKEYFTLSLKKGNTKALRYLINYNEDIDIKKYNLKELDKETLFSLGHYFKHKKYYYQMKKCFLQAIGKDCVKSMYHLALYFKDNKEINKMIKYFKMAGEKEINHHYQV